MKKLLMVAAVAAAASVTVIPTTAGADPGGGADIRHPGCDFRSPTTDKVYVDGKGTILNNPGGGSRASCTGLTLAAGETPVTRTTHSSWTYGDLICDGVETPNGQARFNCN